ncbi:MAG: response regulator [Planctomycetota bacterium]|jgi:two-component system response regulator NreC
MTRPVRILCVDDHSFLIEGVRARLELERDLECAGSLPDADDLVREAARLKPDIVLLDIEMPGRDPFEAAEDLRRQFPEVRTVFLSAYVRDHYVTSAVKAGAWGYFSKSENADTLVDGLRKVAAGSFAFSPKVQERFQAAKRPRRATTAPPTTKLDSLTAREREVLRLIGRGLARTEIAKTMSRSPKTIDGHRESIMAKLDIHDRAELVRFAIREGLAEV